jgi:ribosome-associated protein
MTALEKAKKLAGVLDEKKGKSVTILKVMDQTVITDYFVIATATSSTHLKALCDEVEFRLREEDAITADRIEGYRGGGWILVDFSDVIVHIFDANSREFFNLEKLWNGAEEVQFEQKED